LSHPVP